MELAAIGGLIYFVRGQRVMLDSDLAKLYGIPTKSVNLAVKRNGARFPVDFMFVPTGEESAGLRFQIETPKKGRGGRRYLTRAFTEHGVAMLSGVLNSERAVRVNIGTIRTFIRLRHIIASNRDIAERMERIERRLDGHEQTLQEQAEQIRAVLDDIRQLMEPPATPKKRSGFLAR